MNGALQPAPRVRLQLALLLLVGLALAAVVRVPSFPRPILHAFLTAAVLRLTLGRDGQRLAPRPVLQGLAGVMAALSIAYLLLALSRPPSEQAARGEPSALITLMCVVSIFQGLCLLCRQTTFTSFLLILLSSVHASGAAIEYTDTLSLVFVCVYVGLLAWTLLHFERRISLDREADGDGAVRLLRARVSRPVPRTAALRVLAAVVLVGFPIGIVLYLAAPRGLKDYGLQRALAEHREREQRAGGAEITDMPNEGLGASSHITGPGGGKGVPWGSVTEIKRDFSAWFEVRQEGRRGVPDEVILRDNAQDFCTQDLVWKDTLSKGNLSKFFVDRDDGRVDGWTPLGHTDDPLRGRTLRIKLKKGGHRRLYLEPNEVKLRILRGGLPQSGFEVTEDFAETMAVSFDFKANDVMLQRSVRPRTDDSFLRGRESSTDAVPVAYLQVPSNCAWTCRQLALQVVRDEKDPWTRARMLEAWLKSPEFTYTLKLPRVDPKNAMVEFLTRTKSANCEGFAMALTLMLRTLGHPARYVRGFWGGDRLEESGSVILRGHHYHAWTEMHLEGAGWIALNPTPPERRAADADSITVETGTGPKVEEEPFSFLGYDAKQWGQFWGRVGRGLDRFVMQPLALVFSRDGFYAGPLVLLAGLWLLMRRREATRIRRMVVAEGQRVPAGAYGKALILLARKGVKRRGNQTPRAYARLAALRFPQAASPLTVLTRVHELERYGGGATDSSRQRARQALDALKTSLRRKPPPAKG